MRKHLEGLKGQQPEAFEAVASSQKGAIIRIIGYAGTGKTTVLGRIIDYLAEESEKRFIVDRWRIFVGAPTHQAKKVLRSKIKNDTVTISTMHSGMAMQQQVNADGSVKFVSAVQGRLFGEKGDSCEVEASDVVVCEECSMVSEYMGKLLMEMWARCRFTLILVGDGAQIPPVDDKRSYFFTESFTSTYRPVTVSMTDIIRQGENSPIIELATAIRNNLFADGQVMGKLVDGMVGVENSIGFIRAVAGKEISKTMLPYFESQQYQQNHNYVKCIAYNRKVAERYATFIRSKLIGEGITELVNGDLIIYEAPYSIDVFPPKTIQNNDEFRILELKEDVSFIFNQQIMVSRATVQDLYDGAIYPNVVIPKREELVNIESICKKEKARIIKIYNQNERRNAWRVYYSTLEKLSTVLFLYGITAHKSQGNTYDYTLVDAGNIFKVPDTEERNRILYTAITRASQGVYLKLV